MNAVLISAGVLVAGLVFALYVWGDEWMDWLFDGTDQGDDS